MLDVQRIVTQNVEEKELTEAVLSEEPWQREEPDSGQSRFRKLNQHVERNGVVVRRRCRDFNGDGAHDGDDDGEEYEC